MKPKRLAALVRSLLLGLAVTLGWWSALPVSVRALDEPRPQQPAPGSASPAEDRPAVQVVLPPKREGRFSRYYLMDSLLSASQVTGVAWPDKRIGALEGMDITADVSRQFRLRSGKHALAVYERKFCYSLILIYSHSVDKATSAEVGLSTKEGSLEAWLMREEAPKIEEQHLPLERWKKFLALPKEERVKQARVFAFEGTIRVIVEDDSGMVTRVRGIDLRSPKPLPPDAGWLDAKLEQAKEFYEFAKENDSNMLAGNKEWYEWLRDNAEKLKKARSKETATITGGIQGGWGLRSTSKSSSP